MRTSRAAHLGSSNGLSLVGEAEERDGANGEEQLSSPRRRGAIGGARCATTAFRTSELGQLKLATSFSATASILERQVLLHPEDAHVAVCLLPGTELSFAYEVKRSRLWPWSKNIIPHKTAIFRQINVDCPTVHHDALEFPDGDMVLLTYLMEGQEAVVLQLPATGLKAPQRAAYV